MAKYSPYKMKGHTLPGIKQSPAKAFSGAVNWKGLGRVARGIAPQIGIPMVIMKGMRFQQTKPPPEAIKNIDSLKATNEDVQHQLAKKTIKEK